MEEAWLSHYVLRDEDIKKEKELGKGAFGRVWQGVVKGDKKRVAIKEMQSAFERFSAVKSFIREVVSMTFLRHPTVISLIGFTIGESPVVVMPLMQNGSVESLLAKEKKGEKIPRGWNATAKSKTIVGTAVGMAYIHSKGVIHRDFKTANVLLNEHFEPVIADLGTARAQGMDQTMVTGTPLYMAPEMIDSPDDQYTNAVDVFSYGVFLRQMWDDSLILDDKNTPARSSQNLQQRVLKGARLVLGTEIPDFFRELIQACWEKDAPNRPSFADIARILLEKTEDWALPGTDLAALREYERRIVKDVDLTEKAEIRGAPVVEAMKAPIEPLPDYFTKSVPPAG